MAIGTWRPQAWRLSLVVRSAGGEILGVQELEGNDFPTLRTVDSSSFLIPPARGRGYGKQMRTAVLAWPSARWRPGRPSPRRGTTITPRWASPAPWGTGRTAS